MQLQESFRLPELKDLCHPERASYVTRVVNEMVSDGWLTSETREGKYRWSEKRDQFSVESWIRQKTSMQIASSPTEERPRERLIAQGAQALKNSELIAILIRSGRQGESAVQAGQKVANHFSDRLETLPHAGRGELKEISRVIADTAYCQIMAGIELGRRVAEKSIDQSAPVKIRSTTDAIAFCQKRFDRLISDSAKEEFHIVTLDTKNQVVATHQISVGTLDASLVHPREVFKPAIKDSASSILLVHNHPSGDPAPSPEDFRVTTRLESSGELLGIDVLDHIVLGSSGCCSIREEQP